MLRLLGRALPLLAVGVLAMNSSPVKAHCGKCAGDCKEALKQMDAGKLTAAKMVEAAEAASKGKAIGMMVDLEKGKLDAHVYCLAADKVQAVAVGADGKAGKMEEAKDMKGMGDVAKSMDTAKLTMAKVIEAAEGHSKGKALAVVSKATGGKASFEAYCLVGEKLNSVTVDDIGKATGMTEAKALPGSSHSTHEEKPKPKPGG